MTDSHRTYDTLIFPTKVGTIARKIFPHEATMGEKTQRYKKNFSETNVQLNPVLLVYKDNEDINRYLNRLATRDPDFTIIKDKQYKFWTIANPLTLKKIKQIYDKMPYYIIADGHHRIAAATSISSTMNLMVSLISDKNIHLNQVIRELKHCDLSLADIIDPLRSDFTITQCGEVNTSSKEDLFYIHHNGLFFKLKLKKHEVNRRVQTIHYAHDFIFKKILKINDSDLSRVINYIPANNQVEIKQYLKNNKEKTSIIFPEFSMSDVISAAKKSVMLPPHSTYFEPKFINHLITNQMAEPSRIQEK